MSAVLAFPPPSSARVFGSDITLRSTVDLSDLSNEQQAAIRAIVGESRFLQKRIGYDQAHLAARLSKLHELLGPQRFTAFVEAELEMNIRTARRYLHVSRMIDAHFRNDEGLIEIERVRKVTNNAFKLLSAETDEHVIAEIKEIADNGGKVDEATVKHLLNARDEDYAARIASAEASAEAAQSDLQRAREQHEVETLRLTKQMDVNAELLRRANEQRLALEQEIQEIKGKATIVEEKIVTKEVVPQGYTDVVEAVTAEQKKLADAQNRRAQAEQQIAELERQRQHLAELHAGAEELLKLREQVEAIMLKYPVARMQAISGTDQANRALIEGLASTMVELGKQLLAGATK